MVAYLTSIFLPLLLASTTIPSALAAPAPTPQSQTEKNYVTLSYRQGSFGKPQTAQLFIPDAPAGTSPSERLGYHSIDSSKGALYDVAILDGPYDAYCGFSRDVSTLPEWVPGQVRISKDPRRIDYLTPVDGPVKKVSDIWCHTTTGLRPAYDG